MVILSFIYCHIFSSGLNSGQQEKSIILYEILTSFCRVKSSIVNYHNLKLY